MGSRQQVVVGSRQQQHQPRQQLGADSAGAHHDWQLLKELAQRDDGFIAIGPEEVHQAFEQGAIAVLFVVTGRFPDIEILVPGLASSGLVCRIVNEVHTLFAEMSNYGLAAMLCRPRSSERRVAVAVRHWKMFAELAQRRDGHIAFGPEEVYEAHEQAAIEVIFVMAGRFPEVERSLPNMAAAGVACHVVSECDIYF